MKRSIPVFAALAVLAVSCVVLAQTQDPTQRRPQGIRKALRKADLDHDGRISREEWNRNPKAFERLDSNNDGFITREEFQAARQTRARRGAHIAKRLREADKNNDGQISRDEWPGPAEMFDRLDGNHDGVVTREEIRAHRRSRPGAGTATPPRRPDTL